LGRVDEPEFIPFPAHSEPGNRDLNILLAEHNPINQELAVVLLRKAGYSVDAVETGA